MREARRLIRALIADGRQVKILCVGRKGRDQLRRDFGKLIIGTIEDVGKRKLAFSDAQAVAERIRGMFDAGEFDVATLYFSEFKSVITQKPTALQLIPAKIPQADGAAGAGSQAAYEFEPDENEILAELLPRNLATQVYRGLLGYSAERLAELREGGVV